MNVWPEAILILLVAIAAFRTGYKVGAEDGRKTGYDAGYTRGRKEVDNWWCGIDEEAHQRENGRAA